MRVLANGRSRAEKLHDLTGDRGISYRFDNKDGMRISFSTPKIALNGHYNFQVVFSRQEIAEMFFKAFRHESVEAVVRLIDSE